MDIRSQLIAHRGSQAHYPENSHQAVAQALALGAQHIEVDIQLNADKTPIVCHDTDLSRLTGQALDLTKLTDKALESLSLHEPERLGDTFHPTPVFYLSDCLALLKQHNYTQLYIEIKQESIDAFSLALVAEAIYNCLYASNNSELIKRCWLISFNKDVLNYIYKQYTYPRLVPVLEQWGDWEHCDFEPPLLFTNTNLLPETINTDIPIAIYEVTTKEYAINYIKRGIKLIETFDIKRLIQP